MKYFLMIWLTAFGFANAQNLDGNAILKMVDENISSRNKKVVSKMIVHSRRASRTIESQSWIEGTSKSFTEYLAPAREKGTKMLKLEDQLWTYSPQTDRTIRIAGHMLRQSVMGSDLSYEDMMEDPKLTNMYNAELLAEETVGDRVCWVLLLKAKRDDVAYKSRKMWVDMERKLALKEERFAKSGKLLKTTEIQNVLKIDNRWYPQHMVFKDELLGGKGTEFLIEKIEFDVAIPSHLFTKASLRK